MIKIDTGIKPADLDNKLKRFWKLSEDKIKLIEKNYDVSKARRFLLSMAAILQEDGPSGRRGFNTVLLFYSTMLRVKNHSWNQDGRTR